ncbi:molecular chaperone [Grimontia hollisae]|uniref:molecular chaperone n=1 Tax=Grimontia hollisae TaxID=673 RepID=UPI000DFE8673|nr:molecular chaperone [Grimontia hollisae]STQ76310.1 Uncharacterised protein [Grimontia hollisae]
MLVNNNTFSHQYTPVSSQAEGNTGNAQKDTAVDSLLESQPSRQNNAMLRKAAEEVATTNKEQEIADSLINAIDDHTIHLEAISNWTEGGLKAFQGALEMMAQNMMTNKPQNGEYGSYYEDLFQLVMLDVLANAEAYGFTKSDTANRDDVFLQFLSWSLEYVGTGQHNSWVETLPDPSDFAGNNNPVSGTNGNKGNHLVKIANHVWEGIKNAIDSGHIPDNSLASRLMKFISSQGNNSDGSISSTLPKVIYDNLYTGKNNETAVVGANEGYYNSGQGGWITNSNNNMSPLMRLTALSYILAEVEELSTSEVNTIFYGKLEDINNLYKKIFKIDSAQGKEGSIDTKAPDIYHFIIRWNKGGQSSGDNNCTDGKLEHDNNGWQNCAFNHNSQYRPQGVSISLDFAGELNFDWLNNLANNYPKRVLGDEDIKEINRLGDSAKMIMQTLKYWFQIMRDERVAIARNI